MNFYGKHFWFLLLVTFSACGFSQVDDQFNSGFLLDAGTGEPVVFATIRVKGKALGVVSNSDGGFKVPVAFQLKGEELEISSMGYETKTIVFSELKKNSINQIFLDPSIFQLQETVVTGNRKRLSARKIIKKAIANIPNNYPVDPIHMVGYYRDYQLKKEEYVNLNEAIVGIYDEGFEEKDYLTTQYELYS